MNALQHIGDEDTRFHYAVKMPTFGRLDEYKQGTSWDEYTEILENYFGANGIVDEERQRQVFLASVGREAYHLISTLTATAKPSTKTFAALVALVKTHLNPAPSRIVSRFKFYTLKRKEGESIASFVVNLKQAATDCKFTDLNEHLRDIFIVGINNEKIQTKLLSLPDTISFDEALETALAMEAAETNAKDIRAVSAVNSGVNSGASYVAAEAEVNKIQAKHTSNVTCFSCGGNHFRQSCKFRDAICHRCNKKGHIQKVCRSMGDKKTNPRQTSHNNHSIDMSCSDPATNVGNLDHSGECYSMFCVTASTKKNIPSIEVVIQVESKDITMQVDTGASITLISEDTYKKQFSEVPLQDFNNVITTYTGEVINVHGYVDVNIMYKGKRAKLPLVVVGGNGPSLLGRNWLAAIRLDWRNICHVQSTNIDDLLAKFPQVFENGLSKYTGPPVKLFIDGHAKPRFFKPRPVPYALKDRVEEAIERNVQQGIWEAVDYSDWAAPVVPVMKSDGTIRLCGDYKVTINQACKIDPYPLPRIEDMFAELRGGQMFTKIDLRQAYAQIPVDEECQKYLTVNKHMGLFKVKRLPFGVNAAVGCFQRIISTVLKGLKGVCVYLDDILVTGEDNNIHLQNVQCVLERLKQAGLQAKRDKCTFLKPSVEYLGHRIDAEGLHPIPDKVKAVKEAPCPTNKAELRSCLGLITYYSKFLKNLSSKLTPLYELTKNDTPWKWGKEEETAFSAAKGMINTTDVLVHYGPQLPLLVQCDASHRGIG